MGDRHHSRRNSEVGYENTPKRWERFRILVGVSDVRRIPTSREIVVGEDIYNIFFKVDKVHRNGNWVDYAESDNQEDGHNFDEDDLMDVGEDKGEEKGNKDSRNAQGQDKDKICADGPAFDARAVAAVTSGCLADVQVTLALANVTAERPALDDAVVSHPNLADAVTV
ncbi:hypothetical protein PR202_ga19366 [Eleusine coracana subsp. coracana]|uniref:Uncharacterized protein n=1 Tax=Eleusine coracana subsp. coracana TaxID=191504 RepID=A0AAV5CW92_ELECO|nr:hypothetical protein PR202_ga19366 [Eleusine coracana subsp. coracana]